tara:strand:+ start:504 stop:797 length:294 start_codon:yes stop_codon:yes gene_type:complete
MVTFIWTSEALVLVGRDENGKELARVKTGGTHWDFQFTDIGGNGRVRVGPGCNYNPLDLIQEMFQQVVRDESIAPPVGDIFFDDRNELPDDFVKEWE